ncbi:MAG: two-component system sensor histidine kinase NtrB [Planctomycetota bacterium]
MLESTLVCRPSGRRRNGFLEAGLMNGDDRSDGASAPDRSRRHFVPVLSVALGALVVIFVLYELAERMWLRGEDTQMLGAIRMVRGIVTATVAAVLVGWLIVRRSPPLLATMPSDEEWVRGARPSERERMVNYARWFILMRWITVVAAAALIFISVWVARLLPSTVSLPLLLMVAVLAGSNVLYAALLRRGILGPHLLKLQVYGDLVILTVLLHFSGGIENPLSLVMLIHVIIGGIVLSRRQCFAVAATGSVLFGLLALAEGTSVLEHYTLLIFPHFHDEGGLRHAAHEPLYVASRVGLHSAILLLTAYFVTTLADRLRHDERQLEAMADRALAEEQLLERSLETTGTALRVVDRDLRSCWTNTRWQTWFGRSASGSVASERLNGERSAARQAFRDGRTRTTELAMAGDGPLDPTASAPPERVFQLTSAALHDAGGHVHQVAELAQEVTGQKQTQEQLIRAGQLAAVGELAGRVAHEVNNPIAIISAKTRLLLSDHRSEMSDKTAAELAKIIDLSDRVARIARGLLSYCRPSGVAHAALDIQVPIRKALAMVEQRTRDTGVLVKENLPDRLPEVRGNAQEMEQLFLNLFLNALDAMQDGGQLIISARPDRMPAGDGGHGVAVTIEDTGGGIPQQLHERIFQPFYTTKTQEQGTGLGLSICEGLVRSHNGRIALDSKVGEGTRVTVHLPIETEAHEREADHGENANPGR